MSENSNNGAAAGNNTQQQFAIQRLYLKDVSFETPGSPEIFTQEWQPEVGLELSTQGNKIADDAYEVVLTITVTCKAGERTAYLVEVKQAGIFTVTGFDEATLSGMLGSYCPNILFPYAREVISSLVTKGSFPQVLLAPINFDALYAQHLAQQQEQAGAATPDNG